MTPTEQEAFDAIYAAAVKQSRPGTMRDIASLCYEAAITTANAAHRPTDRDIAGENQQSTNEQGAANAVSVEPQAPGEARLAKYAKHLDGCLWSTPLTTGVGNWHCTCGLDSLVLDGELIAHAQATKCAEGFGNKHPEFRYAGYKNDPLKAGATREQIAAYEEGKNAQQGIGGTP